MGLNRQKNCGRSLRAKVPAREAPAPEPVEVVGPGAVLLQAAAHAVGGHAHVEADAQVAGGVVHVAVAPGAVHPGGVLQLDHVDVAAAAGGLIGAVAAVVVGFRHGPMMARAGRGGKAVDPAPEMR